MIPAKATFTLTSPLLGSGNGISVTRIVLGEPALVNSTLRGMDFPAGGGVLRFGLLNSPV